MNLVNAFLQETLCVTDRSGILLWSFCGTKDTADSRVGAGALRRRATRPNENYSASKFNAFS